MRPRPNLGLPAEPGLKNSTPVNRFAKCLVRVAKHDHVRPLARDAKLKRFLQRVWVHDVMKHSSKSHHHPVVDGLTSKLPAGEKASVAGIDVNASVLASANTLNGALKAKRTVKSKKYFFHD